VWSAPLLSPARVVPIVGTRCDQSCVYIIGSVVDDDQVGIEIEDAKLEVDQGFPGVVSTGARIDDLDGLEFQIVSKEVLQLTRKRLFVIFHLDRIRRGPAQDHDPEHAVRLLDRELSIPVPQ